ncbi:hypothetical protein [Stenotrophomonas sp. PD6]|uniref:hypothetical protein n=1 Tax=Stenotrophomonas sp. PD6 TaxID=3368612 RepID=UPI003BA39BBB
MLVTPFDTRATQNDAKRAARNSNEGPEVITEDFSLAQNNFELVDQGIVDGYDAFSYDCAGEAAGHG